MDQNLIHIGKAPGCQFTWNESGTFVRDFSLDLKGSSFVWNVTLIAMALRSETMLLHAEHHWVATATPHHESVSSSPHKAANSCSGEGSLVQCRRCRVLNFRCLRPRISTSRAPTAIGRQFNVGKVSAELPTSGGITTEVKVKRVLPKVENKEKFAKLEKCLGKSLTLQMQPSTWLITCVRRPPFGHSG